jgi:hypothetical protein
VNRTDRSARRWKFGVCVQSQPYDGSMCRFNESNITMTAFTKRSPFPESIIEIGAAPRKHPPGW